jgi:hypothetical protein
MLHVTVGSVPDGSIYLGRISGGRKVYIDTSAWEQSKTLHMFQVLREMPNAEVEKIRRAIEKFVILQNA